VTNRPIAVMLAAAATTAGLSACGGSSKSKSTTTEALATTASTTQQVTASSTTSAKKAKTTAHTSSSSTTTTTADAPKHHPHHGPMPDTHKVTPIPKPKSSGRVIGPTPIVCLKGAGLSDAHGFGANRWVASLDNPLPNQIFVDGPFTSVKAAKADAASLQGVNVAERGGVYVVSADLRANVNARVGLVADCLSTTSGSGSLSF
jgi:hypothetical protein